MKKKKDNEVDLFMWDVAESTVTIMAACIPTLRVLLRDVHHSATSSSSPGATGGSRTTRLSQFSMTFLSANRGRRVFTRGGSRGRDEEIEVVEVFDEILMEESDLISGKEEGSREEMEREKKGRGLSGSRSRNRSGDKGGSRSGGRGESGSRNRGGSGSRNRGKSGSGDRDRNRREREKDLEGGAY